VTAVTLPCWRERIQAVEQILADADEIRSSYGFLLMRLAVAKDAQDTYDVCKREFLDHEAALTRLQEAFNFGRRQQLQQQLASLLAEIPQGEEQKTEDKNDTRVDGHGLSATAGSTASKERR
jgi:hypothetical protein